MLRSTLALLLAAPFALGAAPAHAAPDPVGVLCGFSSAASPVGEWQYGEVDAGPIVLSDPADPAAVVFGSVTCTIQNAPLHRDPDLASLTGNTTPAVVAVAGTVAYEAAPDDVLYLCTRVDVAGGPTLYYDNGIATNGGAWSTSDGAECTGPGVAPAPDPWLTDLVYEILHNSTLCATTAGLFPPDGDVPGVWNCPPY